MRRTRLATVGGLLASISATVALAQGGAPVALRGMQVATAAHPESGSSVPVNDIIWLPARDARSPWWAPVLSGVVPGAGQFAHDGRFYRSSRR